ncbi:MAG: PKD domain-containing protein [Saprospiraceae bacterium]
MNDMPCNQLVNVLDPETYCIKDAVTATNENCRFEADIAIDLPYLSNPFFTYVITFGDGSATVESSNSRLTHTYAQEGSYEVCLTYLSPDTEIGFVTCCYTIEIMNCCSGDVVHLTAIEPCWIATLEFDLDAAFFPITVDYGDGTSGVVNSSPVTHNYPNHGCYEVCYTFEPYPEEIVECCELVCLPACCLNPEFELNAILPSTSCINPEYEISDVACSNENLSTTHLWEFSDGTTFEGPNPPPHRFTNFFDADGEVCVTHTVTCCNETESFTVCASHEPGAYLGEPGGTLNIDDLLLFTGETVREFIDDYESGGTTHPLFIEGTIRINKPTVFFSGTGTWNMAKDAEIFVDGPITGPWMTFTLNSRTLQSAARLPIGGGCCRWKGIRSEGLTRIALIYGKNLDAEYAVRYATPTAIAGAPFPFLTSYHHEYLNNYYAIKSERQKVVFTGFHHLTMDGTPHEALICGCDAVNAIDFRNVSPTLSIDVVPSSFTDYSNEIRNYEQAFHFENASLKVRGFDIKDLKDYQPVPGVPNNPIGDAGIGIDFTQTRFRTTVSSLDLDYMHFSDFANLNTRSVAVRDRIYNSHHALTAVAAVAPSGSSISSIRTENLAGGYELYTISTGRIIGNIEQNDISTNGGPYGFGINGNCLSSDNQIYIKDNDLSINSGSNSLMNGGVVLFGNSVSQDFSVLNNNIDVLLSTGAGISISNASGSMVRRNRLLNSVDVTGIRLRQASDCLVDCNNVHNKELGISAELSPFNRYARNYLKRNDRDMRFTAGVGGSRLKWNIFEDSDVESILYDAGAITGKQHHIQYNRWLDQNALPADELRHPGSNGAVALCQFWYPGVLTIGNELRPMSNPLNLFSQAPTGAVDTIPPADFCTAAGDVFNELQAPDDSVQVAYLVADTSYWGLLTLAEKTLVRQNVYGLLLEHPGWVGTSTNHSTFKALYDNDFVGKSERLKQDWQALLQDIAAQQATFDSVRVAIAARSFLIGQWVEAIAADTTLQDSLSGLITLAAAEGDSLSGLIMAADSILFLSVQDAVDTLLLQNAALEDSTWHYWCEKRYNEIAIQWMIGVEPDSLAGVDLREIAQTCLDEGGRAVLSARGLCEVWLKEFYGETGCQAAQERSAAPEMEKSTELLILPNPARDQVSLRLNTQSPQGDWHVQVFNLSGALMQQNTLAGAATEWAFSVQDWPSGVYVVRLMNGTKTLSQTFVAQHR